MPGTPIPEALKTIFTEEIDDLSAISESTWYKIGQVINFISVRHAEAHEWKINGRISSMAVDGVDGKFICPFNMEIIAISAAQDFAGSSGDTEIDVDWFDAPGSNQGSIFSTKPKFNFTTGDDSYFIRNFVTVQDETEAGITLPVLSKSTFNFGDALQFNVDSAQVGGRNLSLQIYYRPI